MSNNQVARIEPQDVIVSVKSEFNQLASKHQAVQWEAECNYAIQQVYKSKYAAQVATSNPVSVQNAVKNIAAIGLTLNPALKYAYLVPRDGMICLDVSYMGLMHLAQDTGSVIWSQCKIVHENDNYVNKGASVEPEHTYSAFGDRGAIVGAYCVVKLADGDYLTHEMKIDDIYAIRNRSMAYKKNSGPWVTDEKEMIKKTVVKQASKYWPKVERMNEAINMINESGEGIDFEEEKRESVEASSEYQWAQLLVSHMSQGDGEALFDEYMSVCAKDNEYVERAWRHLSAPDRRNIKAMLSEEKAARKLEAESNGVIEHE
jgi:recombination protein RecT